MKVYRGQTYLPARKCKRGHTRTEANTRWRLFTIKGKYTYQVARCIICENREWADRYQHHKRMRELRDATRPPGPDHGDMVTT